MYVLSLVRAVVTLLSAVIIRPFDREDRVEAVAVTNHANISSSSQSALTWPRGPRESPLNLASNTKKTVTRQAAGQNFTGSNFRAAADKTHDEKDDDDDDGIGNLDVQSVRTARLVWLQPAADTVFFLFTARRVCIAWTMPWQDVCLSHAGIVTNGYT